MATPALFERAQDRKANQIRPISCELGLLNRADGSARFSQDKTSVVVAVYGPVEASSRNEQIDKATIEVVFRPASGQQSPVEIEREYLVKQTLESILLTSLHPRTTITVVIQVLQDDGSLLSAAINGACLALLDAGVPASGLVAAVSIMLKADGTLWIDPDVKEEKNAASLITLAFTNTSEDIVLSDTRGLLTEQALMACIDLAQKATTKIHDFFRLSIEKKLSKLQ
eukprot:TRINITY_DN1553_c0_g2_i1.p1 TRINITY_DN1553_c0_g2~~TRINITY_DN1553_c0_g2_i1.p1  ORF type:complete len:244 (+),score=19.74 TRINITY_DN1553_c0_g2_i1:53-733(+)